MVLLCFDVLNSSDYALVVCRVLLLVLLSFDLFYCVVLCLLFAGLLFWAGVGFLGLGFCFLWLCYVLLLLACVLLFPFGAALQGCYVFGLLLRLDFSIVGGWMVGLSVLFVVLWVVGYGFSFGVLLLGVVLFVSRFDL